MPVDNHIALEGMNGRQVVRYRSAARDVVLEVEATGTVGPAGPGSAAPNVTPPHKWTPAFRFYRLSQSSRDHFEAYRNLFLGLEALLDQLFRKRSNEREKAWLCRSVRAAGAKIDLQRLATPEIADPANDIVDRLWNIRCKLFHAKTGKALIPDERVSYTDVADAYPLLLALWTEIAHSWLGPIRRGASFSRSLRLAMLEAWACSSRFGVTSDATPPPNRGEWPAVLPDSPVSMFSRPTSIIEGPRGCMALSSSTEVSDLPAGQVVARILAVGDDGRPKMSDSIAGGLTLDGADIFETVWTFGPLLARYGQRTGFPGM